MSVKIDYGNKNLYKNSILSIVYKVVSMLLAFVSAPLLLHCLGEEKYGTWTTIGSLISWIYYSDLGIGSGLRNKLAASLAENDIKASKGYLAISYVLLGMTTVVFFVVAVFLVLGINISAIFNLSLEEENINICLLAAVSFACVNFILSLVNNVFYALQRASAVSFFNILGQFFYVIMLIGYYIIGNSFLIYVAVGEGCCQALKNLIETGYVFRKYPELKFQLSDAGKEYSRDILSFGILIFISQISSYILNSTDNLVISGLFSTADVTPYNFCYKYFNMINAFYLVIINTFISAYTVAYSKMDIAWMKKTLKKSMWLFAVVFVGSAIAAVIFVPFSRVWLQQTLHYEKGLVIATLIYFLLLMFSHNYSSFLTGIGKIKEFTVGVAISAVINIPISVILARDCNLGVTGVILGSAVSILPCVLIGPWETYRFLKEQKNIL